jgi:hypothetical protein
VRKVQQHHIAAAAFDQGADRGPHSAADDQIAFPVARHYAVVNLGRSLVQRLHVLDLVWWCHPAALSPADRAPGAQLAILLAEHTGEQGPIDGLGTGAHRRPGWMGAGQEPRDLLR